MKKVLLLLSMSVMLFSCTTDNVESADKTSVVMDIVQDTPPTSKTGKEVKRGTIYAWVKDISLSATNNETGHNASELFTLVDNLPSADGGVFRLDNVAVGLNTIKASSTTNTIGSISLTNQTDAVKDILSKCVKANPYAVYNSPNIVEDIQSTPNNVIRVPMNTINGRVIGVFSCIDAYLLRNYKLFVTASIVKADGSSVIIGTNQITGTNNLQFYWSNENAVQGAKVTYVIDVVSAKNNKLVNTMVETVFVKASTSYSCSYEIKTPDSMFKHDNKFDFVFQKWVEETCPTCPGN